MNRPRSIGAAMTDDCLRPNQATMADALSDAEPETFANLPPKVGADRVTRGRRPAGVRVIAGLGLAIAASSMSAHAQPVTGDCLWNALPSARQDEIRDAFRESGADGVLAQRPLPSSVSVIACSGGQSNLAATESIATRATYIFIPTVIERAAKHRLGELGFSADALDRSWTHLEESERATVRRAGEALIKATGVSAQSEAPRIIFKAARAAGWEADGGADGNQLRGAFVEYYLTRGAREQFESSK